MKKHLGLFVGLFVLAAGAKADRISDRCMPYFWAGDLASFEACQAENREVNIALAKEFGVNVYSENFDPNFPCKGLTPGSVVRTKCMDAAGKYNVRRAIENVEGAQSVRLTLPTAPPAAPVATSTETKSPTSYTLCTVRVDTKGQKYDDCQTVTQQFASFLGSSAPR